MENEGHYIAVGSFALLTLALLLTFLVVIASHKNVAETQRYEIHFDGSVAGLDEGGEVRYLGVRVGSIYQIKLVPDKPRQVRILIDIRKTVPIYRDTVAKLKLQGVTGIAFIELYQEGNDRTRLAMPDDEHVYPVIRATDSDLEKVVEALPTAIEQMRELAARSNRLLSDQNLQTLGRILVNTEQATAEFTRTMSQFSQTMQTLENSTRKLEPDLQQTLAAMNRAMQDLAEISRTTRRLVERNRDQLDYSLSTSLPELQAMMEQSRMLLEEMRKLTRKLERDPSQLIYRARPGGMEVAP